jgi:hypothetical protein
MHLAYVIILTPKVSHSTMHSSQNEIFTLKNWFFGGNSLLIILVIDSYLTNGIIIY